MRRLQIGCDLDGTVYPWTQAANAAVMERFPETEDPGEHQTWDYLKNFLNEDLRWYWLWSHEAAEAVFGRYDLIYPHAAEVVNALAEEHDVHFVTHRNPDKSAVATALWIKHWFKNVKGIYILDNSVEKHKIADWDVFIDDKVEVIHGFADDPLLLLPRRPWNEHCAKPYVFRFDDWREVPHILEGEFGDLR